MLPLARNSLRLVRAFRHQFPQHITGHTSPVDEECRISRTQYTPASPTPGVACVSHDETDASLTPIPSPSERGDQNDPRTSLPGEIPVARAGMTDNVALRQSLTCESAE